jgi:hypothetical protein
VAWLMSNTTLSTFRYIRASGSGWVLSTSP